MASSFHWAKSGSALPEFARILRPGGFFTAIWNTRAPSALNDKVEAILHELMPSLQRVSSGNSKDWTPVIISTGHFKDVRYIEFDHEEHMSRDRYMGIWRSVNDVRSQLGEEKFAIFLDRIKTEVPGRVMVPYKVKSWTATLV
jgi:hypothetical protein